MKINDPTKDTRRDVARAARRARAAAAGEPRGPGLMSSMLVAGLAAIGGALAAFLADPDRGRARRARLLDQGAAIARRTARRAERTARGVAATASGAMKAASHARSSSSTGATDDVTLAARAETALFRDPSVPKGSINVNAERGTIVLRGEVPTAEMRDRLGEEAERIDGAWSVHNLLRVEGEEADQEPIPVGSR